MLDFIRKQLSRYRDLLANLSRRNKELYYREGKGHSINLTRPPTIGNEQDDIVSQKFVPLRTTTEEFQKLFTDGQFDITSHFLLEETDNPELLKRLDKVRLADDKFRREFGLSGSWLLGPFLCWRNRAGSPAEDLLISPIFKTPISLSKNKKKQWHLKLEDASPRVNPSLKLALKQSWGIELPEVFETETIIDALESIRKILESSGKQLVLEGHKYDSIPKIPPRFKYIKDEDGQIIERQPVKIAEALSERDFEIYQKTSHQTFHLIDLLYVDHLNASRTVLIHDYDEILGMNEMHPILSELFLGKAQPPDGSKDREQLRELDSYKERENFFVVNIDSTQHRAVDRATKTKAIVIQGPPGTGKSQTITNLIADNLANGKRVLFVSEKRPALDVVYSRLQQAKLDSQAVLIHSSDLNKQDLYRSFLELSQHLPDKSVEKAWSEATTKLDKTKAGINAYYDTLAKVHSPSDLSVANLLTITSSFSEEKPNLNLADAFKHLTFSDLEKIAAAIDSLHRLVVDIPNYKSHPWLNRKSSTVFSETLEDSLRNTISQLRALEEKQAQLRIELKTLGGVEQLPPADTIQTLLQADLPDLWLPSLSPFVSNASSLQTIDQALSDPLQMSRNEVGAFSTIEKDADQTLVRELETYYSVPRGWLDWFTPRFWRVRRYRKVICRNWDGTNRPFKAFRLVLEAISEIKKVLSEYRFPVSIDLRDPESTLSSVDRIKGYALEATGLGKALRSIKSPIFDQYLHLDSESLIELKKRVKEMLRVQHDLTTTAASIENQRVNLNGHFEIPPAYEDGHTSTLYDALLATIRDLDKLDRVDLQIADLKPFCKSESLRGLIIETLLQRPGNWGQQAIGSVVKVWSDEVKAQNQSLRTFEKDRFQSQVDEFVSEEKEHREAAREIVNNTILQRWNGGFGEHEGLALLRKEANKQRKVLSPREIMERGALRSMMKLKPIWLMSPLSISQILPLEMGLFDTIIFDEASQVRVEDAVPSIYRANNMIVVGDPKQMPPTNFFTAGDTTDDDEDEETEIAPSILDLASQIYPAEMLEWHYRSRKEALIAFSNRAFYGGRLIAVPNPHLLTEGDAIYFHKISDAYFSQKDGNAEEARATIDILYKLLKSHPDKSFGVIAMGQGQMQALENIVEQRSQTDADFRSLIEAARNFTDGEADAGLFIKNLENVQGDERDIILISVGYAPARPGRKLYLNFGPLSKQGGSRRLNVAITRAKQQIHVFCSFDPAQVPSDEAALSKNSDMAIFGRYLKYAQAISQNRSGEALALLDSFGMSGAITARKSSRFSKDVHKKLADLGYMVSSEIGTCGFFIDLAIHHPVIQTNFILGIECDGAFFHSTPYARDRDKLRQDLLTNRGWRIVRIWSQDWSRDWKSEVRRIDSVIKEILSTGTSDQAASRHLQSVK